MPRGKYARRRQARIDRETGSVATTRPRLRKHQTTIHDVIGPGPEYYPINGWVDIGPAHVSGRVPIFEFEKVVSAIEEAQRLKRSKRKGCSNLDRNMETLGYRRVSGNEMVPEQFEAMTSERQETNS